MALQRDFSSVKLIHAAPESQRDSPIDMINYLDLRWRTVPN